MWGTNDSVKQAGVIATLAGNNVELGADFNRRTVEMGLGSFANGSPIGRSDYRHADLGKFVVENRPALVAAAHTVLLHGLQSTPDVPGYGFSHNWSAVVLGALSLVHADDGRDIHEHAMGGFEKVDEQDELGEEWGPLLAYLFERNGEKSRMAAELRSDVKTPRQGQTRLDLPPAIYAISDGLAEGTQNTQWGKALKSVLGTGIPFEGIRYVINTLLKGPKSKRSNMYVVTATRDGARYLPGRDKKVEAAAS